MVTEQETHRCEEKYQKDGRQIKVLELFITDVLTTIYTSFGFSLALAVLFTYFYLFAYKPSAGGRGAREAIKTGWRSLREDQTARHLFFLSLYVALILFRTLLNRALWLNPLNKVFEGWWIWEIDANGETVLSAECFENLVMLMPVVALSIWTFPEWFRKRGYIKGSFLVAGGMSLFIECCQLFFRLGTFQFSDLVYNTLGGVVVGMIAGYMQRKKRCSEEG